MRSTRSRPVTGWRRQPRTESTRCEVCGLSQRFNEAAFVGDALAGDVERRPVVDGSSNHGQTHGDVHAGLETEDLDGAMTLVVVHGDDDVVVTTRGQEEQGIRG